MKKSAKQKGGSAAAGRPKTGDAEGYRPPWLAAGLATLAVWLLYAITLAPTTAFWDASEYIATAHILGIPHPPGNPTFVVLARAWELLLAPTGLDVAVRINLFSATMSALAHGAWFLMVHRILAFYSEDRTFRLVGAAAAVLISATAFTVWNQSNVNEKVYTVSLFTIAALSYLAFRWRDNLGSEKDHNLILLGIYILALSVGNHLMAFLAAPALFIFVLLVDSSVFLRWRLYAGAALVGVLGLSIHLFLPIRASLDPVINQVDPSTMDALWESLTRQQYDKPSFTALPWDPRFPRNAELFLAQIGNYLQYFDWQWSRSISGTDTLFGGARPLFTALFAGLGAFGAWTHFQRDRISWAYFATLFATLSLGLVIYLNFKYGYSWMGEGVPADRDYHEVRERDYFFLVSFSLWGLWAGIGVAALWKRVADANRQRTTSSSRSLAIASPLLALAFIPMVLNWGWASRADDYAARDWSYNLLMSVEPYGVLITNGDNDTFPLWYLQEVEGIRRDVQVIVMSYLNTDWYVKQLRDLTRPCPEGVDPAENETRIVCQRRYEVQEGPGFYATEALAEGDRPGEALFDDEQDPGPGRRLPTHSIFELSDTEIEQVTRSGVLPIQSPRTLEIGDVQTTLSPGTVMLPADVFLTYLVINNIEDRPIFFATTTQAYRKLALDPHLVRQGVAFKLQAFPDAAAADSGIYRLPDERYTPLTGQQVDLPRTDSLLWNVFMHRGGIPDEWDHWVDAPTQGIPSYYLYAHLAAWQAHMLIGEEDRAERHLERINAWRELAER